MDLLVELFGKLDFFLFSFLNEFQDLLLECVLLLHDLLDVLAEEGLVVVGEFEDLIEGLVELFLLISLDVIFVGLKHRVVNEGELLLAQIAPETILELALHLLNEVSFVQGIALFPERY